MEIAANQTAVRLNPRAAADELKQQGLFYIQQTKHPWGDALRQHFVHSRSGSQGVQFPSDLCLLASISCRVLLFGVQVADAKDLFLNQTAPSPRVTDATHGRQNSRQ